MKLRQRMRLVTHIGMGLLVAGIGAAHGQTVDSETGRPMAGWDRDFYLESPDGMNRLQIGGWIQPPEVWHLTR